MDAEGMAQPEASWAGTATSSGLIVRVIQLACALATLVITVSTSHFSSYPAFCFLAATSSLQCVWTIPPALLNLYTLLSGQWPLENHYWITGIAMISGDSVAATLSLFAASAASGVTMMVEDDLKLCAKLPCARYKAATWMGFASCIALLMTLLFNWLNNAGN